MNNLTEHAKTILRAIADGKKIESDYCRGIDWAVIDYPEVMSLVGSRCEFNLRIKPETRSINGKEFGAPNAGPTDFVLNIQAGPEGYIFCFHAGKDRDTAYQAIVDALEGKNHA